MQYFNFKRLIDKYRREFTVIIPAEKKLNDAGDWVRSEATEKTLSGAIIRHRQSKVYKSNGTLTLNDYALYMTEEPPIEIVGTTVICDNKKFKVESALNNAEYTGIWNFNLKYISAFKEVGADV